MKFLFTKESENMKGYTRCETVAIENELGDFASEEMFLKIKEFLTEETDEKRHVFSNDNPTCGERVFVEVLYSDDLDDITHSQTYDVKTGLHVETGIIVERLDSERFQYVLPHDSMSYLDEVVFKDGLDWAPALDICCRGEEGEGTDIESEFFTHGKDGEIIELDDTSDFRYFVEDWKERLMDSVRTNFEEVIILED
jgi:hypothetical protein